MRGVGGGGWGRAAASGRPLRGPWGWRPGPCLSTRCLQGPATCLCPPPSGLPRRPGPAPPAAPGPASPGLVSAPTLTLDPGGWPWAGLPRQLWPWPQCSGRRRGGRAPRPRPPEDRPQQPRVCLQTWTNAPLAAAAASTTAPTWRAPSSARVRPASGLTRTAGAVPVSLHLSPRGPRLLGTCSWCPRTPLPGWMDPPQRPLPLWAGPGQQGGGGAGRWGHPPGQGPARGSWVVQLLPCPGDTRDRGQRPRGRELPPPHAWSGVQLG